MLVVTKSGFATISCRANCSPKKLRIILFVFFSFLELEGYCSNFFNAICILVHLSDFTWISQRFLTMEWNTLSVRWSSSYLIPTAVLMFFVSISTFLLWTFEIDWFAVNSPKNFSLESFLSDTILALWIYLRFQANKKTPKNVEKHQNH